MKRLAGIVAAVVTMGLVGTARADTPPDARNGQRGCWNRAETLVRTGVEDVLYLEVGVDLRQEAPRAFVCYMAPDGLNSDKPFAGVISAFADPEHGRAGYSCSKRKGWDDLDCGHHSTAGPAQATTPVEHPYGPWGVSVLGLNLRYLLDSSTVAVSVDPPERCTEDRCVAVPTVGATARRGMHYRANGWRCRAEDGACEQAEGPVAVTVGEDDAQPTLSIGDLTLDLPATCVQASDNVRC